jgi:cyclopropane fatty-acyl-phospholipid synthase-like methyltransferase
VTKSEPFVVDATGEAKRLAPATLRNRDAIAKVLESILPARGTVLEIASGTGEHLVHFAARFPHLNWQPSDYDETGLASVAAWSAEADLPNILPPIQIDAAAPDWPIAHVDSILCINMVHISPWAAAQGLFSGAVRLLPSGGALFLYGPYRRAGLPTATSNEEFDASLKAHNPCWGLRQVEDVVESAKAAGLAFDQLFEMPANNLSLVFRR